MGHRRGTLAKLVTPALAAHTHAARTAQDVHAEILALVVEHQGLIDSERRPFRPGRTLVPWAGRVYDEAEVVAAVEASLEFWLTAGRWARRLEHGLATVIGHDTCRLVNSGSSANLLATAALTSPLLGDRRLRRGDEVLTVATGFPTTVAPAVQQGLIPVFVDVDPRTANVDVTRLEDAVSDRTRAVILAHTLGNPFDIDAVLDLCARHDLFLIEDNCDALGSTYTSVRGDEPVTRATGSFGDLATSSFYPAHHITTGEGGAVYVTDPTLERAVTSLRDWGRDCWCDPGKSNTCGQRFEHCFANLPSGYDHKYVYSHFGYNLKMTDLQAAVGVRQLEKLDTFTALRRRNHAYLSERLAAHDDVLQLPIATERSDPSWFGYLLVVRPDAGFTRDALVARLEDRRIQTRMLFAGNVIAQPMFDDMRSSGEGYRVAGPLEGSDALMRGALLVGCFPGLTIEHLDYVADTISDFIAGRA